MNRYYFTYGTSSDFPFKGGWTVVEAETMSQATEIFNMVHPPVRNNIVNCAFIYTEDDFMSDPSMFEKGNLGAYEHERIHVDVSTPDSIQTATLVECSDSDIEYGTIMWKAPHVTPYMVTEKIQEIKVQFNSENIDDWCVDDVIEKLPEEWDVSYNNNVPTYIPI